MPDKTHTRTSPTIEDLVSRVDQPDWGVGRVIGRWHENGYPLVHFPDVHSKYIAVVHPGDLSVMSERTPNA